MGVETTNPCSIAISLSCTIITECTHFLEQHVAIMQFTIVLLKNLVLFPLEQPHFIIAFCVSIHSTFSPFAASTFAPGEPESVRRGCFLLG